MKPEDIELQLIFKQASKEVIHNLGGWEIHSCDTVVEVMADFLVSMGFIHDEVIRCMKSYADTYLDEALEEAYKASSEENSERNDDPWANWAEDIGISEELDASFELGSEYKSVAANHVDGPMCTSECCGKCK